MSDWTQGPHNRRGFLPSIINLAKNPWLERWTDIGGEPTTTILLITIVSNCLLNAYVYTHRGVELPYQSIFFWQQEAITENHNRSNAERRWPWEFSGLNETSIT